MNNTTTHKTNGQTMYEELNDWLYSSLIHSFHENVINTALGI